MVRLSTELIKDDTLERMVEMLKAIAHPVRLQIVNILMNGERSVGDLVKMLDTNQPRTSQQLNILKSRGVLKSRRNGNFVFYSILNDGIKNIVASIIVEV